MLMKGWVTIVTGAGSGIGKEIAATYAKEGAKVIVAEQNALAGQQTVDEIIASGYEAVYVQTDVADADSVKQLFRYVDANFSRLDVLVNNAGIEYYTTIEDTTLEQWNRTMDVDLKGVFLGIKHAIPVMRKQGKGSIVNIASVAGIAAWPGLGVYSAAKGGVVLLTKAAAAENGKFGIRVNCICPGSIRTPLLEREFFGRIENPVLAEKELLKGNPLHRFGTPRDIADAALYLGSDSACFVTGHSLVVDGGISSYVGDLI